MQSKERDLAIIDGIRKAAAAANYDENVANVLCRAYQYIRESNKKDLCMEMTAALYVVLSEMGYYVFPCAGIAVKGDVCFPYAWIMTLETRAVIDIASGCDPAEMAIHGTPVVFGLDVLSQEPTCYQYGVPAPIGMANSNEVPYSCFDKYLEAGWDIVSYLWDEALLGKLDDASRELLRQRNAATQWYVFSEGEGYGN